MEGACGEMSAEMGIDACERLRREGAGWFWYTLPLLWGWETLLAGVDPRPWYE